MKGQFGNLVGELAHMSMDFGGKEQTKDWGKGCF